MNLTVEQLSKATKLSVSTIRLYASQRNLGKKVGGKRIYSQADVQALLKGSKKSPAKKAAKPRRNKTATAAKPTKAKATATMAQRQVSPVVRTGTLTIRSPKPSFFSRLFGGSKQQKKIGLMDVRSK